MRGHHQRIHASPKTLLLERLRNRSLSIATIEDRSQTFKRVVNRMSRDISESARASANYHKAERIVVRNNHLVKIGVDGAAVAIKSSIHADLYVAAPKTFIAIK